MLENINHSFIVRIWVEPRELSGEHTPWRGMVQHVMTGEKTYFQNFDDMVSFISRLMALSVPGMSDSE